MYTIIPTPAGKTLVSNSIMMDIKPLLMAIQQDIQAVDNADCLHDLVLYVLDPHFVQANGQQAPLVIEKLVITVLNVLHTVVEDKAGFCDNLNEDLNRHNTGFEIGFDAVFHPAPYGHFNTKQDFILMAA